MTLYRTALENGPTADNLAEELVADGARDVTTYDQEGATYAEWSSPDWDVLIDATSVGVWGSTGIGAVMDHVAAGATLIALDVIECPPARA